MATNASIENTAKTSETLHLFTWLGKSLNQGENDPLRCVRTQWKKEVVWNNGVPTVTFNCLEKNRNYSVTMTYSPILDGKYRGQWERHISSTMFRSGVPVTSISLPVNQAQLDRENDLTVALREQMTSMVDELKVDYLERQMAGFPQVS